jgi:hypothetical protein
MKFPSKHAFKALIFGLVTICAHAGEKRIHQTDSLGNIQYNKPSYIIQKDGRMTQTDPIGNKLYNKQQYQIKGNEVYQTDSVGNIQYNKPHQKIK